MPTTFNNRILVIDDDDSILSIFKTVLSKDSYSSGKNMSALKNLLNKHVKERSIAKKRVNLFQVDTEMQGESGFNKLKNEFEKGNPYALIFVDMRMPPGWDGVQTIKAIREIDPCVQIVIVTAYSDESIEDVVSQVGFTDRLLYLKKPFDDQEILQLADSLVTRWNLEKRVQYFDGILEDIIGSLVKLDLMDFENTLRPFIQNILRKMGDSMGTEDILLAKVEDENFVFKVGLGCYSEGVFEVSQFQKIIDKLIAENMENVPFSIANYIVIPMSVRNYQNVIIGVLDSGKNEAAGKIILEMTSGSTDFFKQGARLTNLCLEVDMLRNREHELMVTIDKLQ